MTKYIIIALIILLLLSGGGFLWQKNKVLQVQNESLEKDKAALQIIVTAQEKNIVNQKILIKKQQFVADAASALLADINNFKDTKCIGEEHEKILSDVTIFFNSRGLLKADNTDSGETVLPAAGTPHAQRSGWQIKDVIENYLIIIGYSLKLENCVECYENY